MLQEKYFHNAPYTDHGRKENADNLDAQIPEYDIPDGQGKQENNRPHKFKTPVVAAEFLVFFEKSPVPPVEFPVLFYNLAVLTAFLLKGQLFMVVQVFPHKFRY
jgi:hypothetical protein